MARSDSDAASMCEKCEGRGYTLVNGPWGNSIPRRCNSCDAFWEKAKAAAAVSGEAEADCG